jgi:hypothetical protein
MIARTFSAALLLLASPMGGFRPATTREGIPASAYPQIVRVDCGPYAGSAFYIGRNDLVSVNHVTSLPGCTIAGEPFTVDAHSGDFSILTTAHEGDRWLKIDCGGFVKNHRYEAIGYAHGLDTLTAVDVTATGFTERGFSILTGVFNFIPGQSGGAVIDPDTGSVVGTVNTFDAEDGLSGSVAIKDTSLCK